MVTVTALTAIEALEKTIEEFGEDIEVNISVDVDPDSGAFATIFLPSRSTQTSMPFTPNIYAPHGAIFSQN